MSSDTSSGGCASPYGEKSGSDASLIDSTLTSSNPGSYEDLHKKTKGISEFYFYPGK